MLRIEPIQRAEFSTYLSAIAELRIAVFRDWPYLYEGDRAYEERYLTSFAESADAIAVGAWDGDRLVGVSTGAPLEDHAAEFGAPLEAAGLDLSDVFYCAESVLLPAYRGQGAGHAFFDAREAHARRLSRRQCCFCGVVRPADHPMIPEGYRPLDGFWRSRGYAPMEGVIAHFSWPDLGTGEMTEKPLQFWLRTL